MHRFLRTIGFSHIDQKNKVDALLGLTMSHPTNKQIQPLTGKKKYVEFKKEFAYKSGIIVRGTYDELGFFHVAHYFPYCDNKFATVTNDIYVNRRVDTDAYTGMCDDSRIGISLIFYLQNTIDYLRLGIPDNSPHRASIALSGLSLSGKIILGLGMTKQAQAQFQKNQEKKLALIKKAKSGNFNAMNELTLHDLDLYSKINKRIQTEDIYTMVSSCVAPYGSESDNYSILGTILNWQKLTNSQTGEQFFYLQVDCNHIEISVCIHEDDLVGEPMIGRRFKGNIWMQGTSLFYV